MLGQSRFRISLVILILCFCLSAQVMLSVPADGISMLELSEIDFEQSEFEDDYFILVIAIAIAGLIISKYGWINLDFQTADLLPVFPPPKHT